MNDDAERELDAMLTAALTPPAVPPGLRAGIYRRVRRERRARWWSAGQALLAPAAGVATGGVCAVIEPGMAGWLLTAGLALGAVTYAGQLAFVWLTEELGEG